MRGDQVRGEAWVWTAFVTRCKGSWAVSAPWTAPVRFTKSSSGDTIMDRSSTNTQRTWEKWRGETARKGMFRKINNVFRPNHYEPRGRDDASRSTLWPEQDYHSACTVRLVRSTSVLAVGERTQAAAASSLKRSKSTVSIESTLYYHQKQEDRIWLYSQHRNCLEYLEALVALRRQYTKSVSDLKSSDSKATSSSRKKKPAPPPPFKERSVRSHHQSRAHVMHGVMGSSEINVFRFC